MLRVEHGNEVHPFLRAFLLAVHLVKRERARNRVQLVGAGDRLPGPERPEALTQFTAVIAPALDWRSHLPLQGAIRAAEAALAGRGRLLVRPSGTEPLLRVMVEADDFALAQDMVDTVVAAIPASD